MYLDEAHAVGLLGRDGYGLSTSVDLPAASVVMGTFSKALGGAGGYVATDAKLGEYLINSASGFIYSTANSPMVVGAMARAWEMIPSFVSKRDDLFARAEQLRENLRQLGFNTGTSVSPIIPIIHHSFEVLNSLQVKLKTAGISVSFIRPPSVPVRAARLRIALTVTHTDEAINELLRVLAA